MPAEFGSPRNLTISEYLDYFACMYDIPRVERRGRDVIVKGLSTGNKQRLLLAKTLLHDPQVLVLDEPASGLDPRARTELRAIIRELASMGKTIIVSSHILPDIEEISDRLVLDGDLQSLRARHSPTRRAHKVRVPVEQTLAAAEVLSRLAGVAACERRDSFLVVTSEEPDCNFLLAALLQHQIRVLQFADEEPNLEEIFMRSTAGKVT
jgi:ABC-2 type transport system ATP-binding protein